MEESARWCDACEKILKESSRKRAGRTGDTIKRVQLTSDQTRQLLIAWDAFLHITGSQAAALAFDATWKGPETEAPWSLDKVQELMVRVGKLNEVLEPIMRVVRDSEEITRLFTMYAEQEPIR